MDKIPPIKIKRNYEDAKLPIRANKTDSGLDIFAYKFTEFYSWSMECGEYNDQDDFNRDSSKSFTLYPLERVLIDTGISATVGPGYEIKIRPRNENALKKVNLPPPEFNDTIKFWDVIVKRHSSRKFSKNSLTIMDLSLLLYGMEGLTRVFTQFSYRITPSAGGLYPMEIYPVINNITDDNQIDH